MDFITLGPVPVEEDCCQVGQQSFGEILDEADKYVKFLQKHFEDLLKDSPVSIRTKKFYHDFGSYAEAIVCYNDNDPLQLEIALTIESNLPLTWEDEPYTLQSNSYD